MTKLPEYNNPPLVEVVFGVSFSPLEKMKSAHIGGIWSSFQSEFPDCQDQPPIVPPPPLDRGDQSFPLNINVAISPLLPRTWFLDRPGNQIIQIQSDRFLFNWRKVKPEDEYLRFDQSFSRFKRLFQTFSEKINSLSLGQINPKQYELTYVNHIPVNSGWNSLNDIQNVFPDFKWTPRKNHLEKLDSVNFRSSFFVPDKMTRLTFSIRNVITKEKEDKKPLLIFELTGRGFKEEKGNKDLEDLSNWFEASHEMIVLTFADVTCENIQKDIWKKKE